MLLSILCKVFCRIILERLKHALHYKLGCEQAGFRKDNKFCTDHIVFLRIFFKQSTEWQTPLYMIFIDFQEAFDRVERNVIWQLTGHYGVHQSLLSWFRSFMSCLILSSHSWRESVRAIWDEHRGPSRLLVVTNDLNGCRVDYERDRESG